MCRIRHPSRIVDGGVDPRRGLSPLGSELQELGIGLADLTELTLDTVIFLDADGTVRYWNHGASLMFGYEREEALGRNIQFLIPEDLRDAGEVDQLRATCSAEGSVHSHTTRRVRKDGTIVWVSLARTASMNREGREVGVIATMRDITAERERERELERSRSLALVGDLAAKIAHEVKNPLAGIHAALQVIEGDLDPSDPRHEVFDAIADEVSRLNDITQNLLRFATPPVPKLRRADLRTFLVDVAGDLERLSMATPGQIDVEGLEGGLDAPFDRLMLGQVFTNLILNGIQATGGSGKVRLSSRRHHGNVAIDVADTGPGIKSESRASIFEPFFTTKTRGTGLGLSIAKKNVEAHGGTIRLRSHRGRGAIFRVELPMGG